MISDAQAQRMEQGRASRDKQNKKHPLLINIEDGRLIPNVPLIGGRAAQYNADGKMVSPAVQPHPKYRIYMGDPKANHAQRMNLLATQGIMGAIPVGDANYETSPDGGGRAEIQPIDIDTAKPPQLIEYAMAKYNHEFEPNTQHNKMRAILRQLEAQNATELG